jgi:hypothetical protein
MNGTNKKSIVSMAGMCFIYFFTIAIMLHVPEELMIVKTGLVCAAVFGIIIVILYYFYTYFSAFKQCAGVPRINISFKADDSLYYYEGIGISHSQQVKEMEGNNYIIALEDPFEIYDKKTDTVKVIKKILIQSSESYGDLFGSGNTTQRLKYNGFDVMCPVVGDHQLLFRGYLSDDTAVFMLLSDKEINRKLGLEEGLGLMKSGFTKMIKERLTEELVAGVVNHVGFDNLDKITKHAVQLVALENEEISKRTDLFDIIEMAYRKLVEKVETPTRADLDDKLESQIASMNLYPRHDGLINAARNAVDAYEIPPVSRTWQDTYASPSPVEKQEEKELSDPNLSVSEAIEILDGYYKRWNDKTKSNDPSNKI